MDLGTRYDPKELEKRIYNSWEKSGLFNPDNLSKPHTLNPKPFSIVLPPPNVTGTLHVGHALMLVVEDILVRFHRMKGDKTLWIPGTDHAAIATQEKVEREIYKSENKTRHDLGRVEFLRRVDAFAKESHDTIVRQIKAMGASLDWSREAFTLDEPRSLAVRTAFKKMYDAGLIYRGSRIVNWDPKLQTTVSDDEIEWLEEKSAFYYLKYGPFVIGTARPETKFGDKYVVMHPDDKRYKKYKHGEKLEVEWINGKITTTVIKDAAADPKFGTGVMTITPSHDATDFDIAERHKLDKEQIIDFNGKLMPIAGEFQGQHIKKARALIVEKLKVKGLIEKIDENYTHRVATSSRGGGVIEPQVMEQWFINVNSKISAGGGFSSGGKIQWNIKGIKSGSKTTLKEIMTKAVKSGQIKIIPKRFEKIYFHWIKNLRDWCISRQIWYGHRLPVWFCRSQTGISNTQLPISNKNIRNWKLEIGNSSAERFVVSVDKPKMCPFCKRCNMEQAAEVLDTWFSSGLWTFSTLGWPFACAQNQKSPPKADQPLAEKIKNQNLCNPVPGSDLDLFHPTTLLETGYDILFFWVARMILMSGFLLGNVPFKTVYLHGLVRDEKGRKMSKSLGNVIDPLTFIDKYGADALRMAMIVGNAPGNDLNLSEDKVRGYRNFATKIWNIGRFIAMNYNANDAKRDANDAKFSAEDKKNFKKFAALKKIVTKHIEKYELHLAGEKIYHYIWHEFADKIIESAKIRLRDGTPEERSAAQAMLKQIFLGCLKILHPFMPFITEELYQELYVSKKDAGYIMMEEW